MSAFVVFVFSTSPPGAFSPFSPAGRRKMASLNHPKAKAMFLSSAPGYEGTVTRLDLVCQYDPFSKESIRLLGQIEQRQLLEGTSSQPALTSHERWPGEQGGQQLVTIA